MKKLVEDKDMDELYYFIATYKYDLLYSNREATSFLVYELDYKGSIELTATKKFLIDVNDAKETEDIRYFNETIENIKSTLEVYKGV